MPMQYATTEPAADPLPGPTETPNFFAIFVISCTIKKYPGYPVFLIVSNSNSNLSINSSFIFPYLSLAPSYVIFLRKLF